MTAAAVDFIRVPLDSLEPGRVLQSSIFTEDSQVPLVGTGQQLTEALVERIRQRDITHVLVGTVDLPAPEAAPEEPVVERSRTKFVTRGRPLLVPRPKTKTNPKSEAAVRAHADKFDRTVDDLGRTFEGLSGGRVVSGHVIDALVDDCLQQIGSDVDLFLALGTELDMNRYPMSHGIQVARLAMATGAVLGMDARSLSEMGAGCLLHDVGMLAIDPGIVTSERPLDRVERLELMKHPVKTFEMISRIPGLPLGARLVAYQMHERLDGSGYPRGLNGAGIHVYTRIAMLADTYVAMTSRRPHRLPVVPYYAMASILQRTAKGEFDPEAMQGLLDTLSLFPVGSHVELDDGRIGTVVRAHLRNHTRPVVECWRRETPDEKEVVDLAEKGAPAITLPLASPE